MLQLLLLLLLLLLMLLPEHRLVAGQPGLVRDAARGVGEQQATGRAAVRRRAAWRGVGHGGAAPRHRGGARCDMRDAAPVAVRGGGAEARGAWRGAGRTSTTVTTHADGDGWLRL